MTFKYLTGLCLTGALFGLFSCTDANRPIWQDEFDGDTLDESKWTAYVGDGCPQICGFGNHELQYYTDSPENVKLEDGKLVITARKDSMKNSAYTSAKLVTQHKGDWKYGRIEVRAKIPSGKGNWPAIWMLPTKNSYGGWPRSGEIDIMEHVGYDQGNMHGTVHTESFNHIKGTQKGDSIQIADISDKFHVYAIEWSANKIDFFMDDEHYHTFENTGNGPDDWPFDQPFYLILNLAVGGDWGGKYGVANDIFPNRYEIDYVRVFELPAAE
ncbi:glycoside hydrolase family 16 protein [Roseivirga pacifica]|uniref:glycoside hydrolase family 16 protein n=1 Tax=Roseivirga pacifica TaxID=1267423 RepID=UPI003BB055E0